jgi:hypothetical protein
MRVRPEDWGPVIALRQASETLWWRRVSGYLSGRIRRFILSLVGGVQANSGDSRGFLHQVVGRARSLSRHDRPCGQSKTEGVRLVVKIENYLSRHIYFSLSLTSQDLNEAGPIEKDRNLRRRWRCNGRVPANTATP